MPVLALVRHVVAYGYTCPGDVHCCQLEACLFWQRYLPRHHAWLALMQERDDRLGAQPGAGHAARFFQRIPHRAERADRVGAV